MYKRQTLTTAHGDFGGTHKLYCIDKGGLAIWGIADDGDVYKKHRPSEAEVPLSKKEQEYIFWGILTLQASLGVKKANSIINIINSNAPAQGKIQIRKYVTEEDLTAVSYTHLLSPYVPVFHRTSATDNTDFRLYPDTSRSPYIRFHQSGTNLCCSVLCLHMDYGDVYKRQIPFPV